MAVSLGEQITAFVKSGDDKLFQSLVSARRDIPTRQVKDIFLACKTEGQKKTFWFKVLRHKGLPTADLEEIVQQIVDSEGKPSVYANLAQTMITNRSLRGFSLSSQSVSV